MYLFFLLLTEVYTVSVVKSRLYMRTVIVNRRSTVISLLVPKDHNSLTEFIRISSGISSEHREDTPFSLYIVLFFLYWWKITKADDPRHDHQNVSLVPDPPRSLTKIKNYGMSTL